MNKRKKKMKNSYRSRMVPVSWQPLSTLRSMVVCRTWYVDIGISKSVGS
jgi:hypothetical protein